MAVKAKLQVVLKADDTVVAESADATLWQKVLLVINKGAQAVSGDGGAEALEEGEVDEQVLLEVKGEADAGIRRFAREVGVDVPALTGACSPSAEAPYLHLDVRCWEALKKNTPERGADAISPIVLAATLLALWSRAANLGTPTQAQAQAVLETIHLRDSNPSRAIKGCDWLQSRARGTIVLNPAQASGALRVVKAYCTKKRPVIEKEK